MEREKESDFNHVPGVPAIDGAAFLTASAGSSTAFASGAGISMAFAGRKLRGKSRFTTRGLHRTRPYEIPDCIGSGKLMDPYQIVDGELDADENRSRPAAIGGGGDADDDDDDAHQSLTRRKEKWNRHNVGKDFNTICQEAKWQG